ncbi:MAG: YraN family protein [Chitinophagales bacterium]
MNRKPFQENVGAASSFFYRMSKHNEIGALGEQLAQRFLQQKNYTILHQNWRWRRAEIDIIALHQQKLIFIEVKTRTSNAFMKPEEAVSPAKQKRLAIAAQAFVDNYPEPVEVRFDIVAIVLYANLTLKEIKHFEDAFFVIIS